MVNLSWSGVEWNSKNCVILKVQLVGSDPSNLETSSFIRWKEVWVCGVCLADDDGGDCSCGWFASSWDIRWRRSSIFEFIASCEAVSLAIASPKHSDDAFERVPSAIDAHWKHHCYSLVFEVQANLQEARGGRNDQVLFHASQHMITQYL